MIEKLNITIVEEFSDEAKKRWDVSETTLEHFGKTKRIEHRFCTPGREDIWLSEIEDCKKKNVLFQSLKRSPNSIRLCLDGRRLFSNTLTLRWFLLIVVDHLRCRFARFKAGAHFLDLRCLFLYRCCEGPDHRF
jgi:hypothetical protein